MRSKSQGAKANVCRIWNMPMSKSEKCMITNELCNHKVHTDWMIERIIKHNKLLPPEVLKWPAKGCVKSVKQSNIKYAIKDRSLVVEFLAHQHLFNFVKTNHSKSLKSYCFKCEEKSRDLQRIEKWKRKKHIVISLNQLFKELKLKRSKIYHKWVKTYQAIIKQIVTKLEV